MWRRLAACAVLLAASGCTFAFPFEEADTSAGSSCGDCELCVCVDGDAHDPSFPTNAVPDPDCCTQIHGDFTRTALPDWYVLHLSAGEVVDLNACSTSSDLHLEVNLYGPGAVPPGPELDRELVDGFNCAPTLTFQAESDGDYTIRVFSLGGTGGSYKLTLLVS